MGWVGIASGFSVEHVLLVLPQQLHASKELLFGGVYPCTGGVSGNCPMKSPRAALKPSRLSVMLLTLLGSRFQGLTAFSSDEKEILPFC